MATFSVNQVRQLYVATALKTPHVLASDAAGSIAVKNDTVKSHLYFEYKGADNLMRSDLIDTKNILYAKATDATAMAHNLKSVTVALDSNVNGGAPVAGQDYILRIAFKQYVGMSDEDQYFKYGMVHAYAGMTASDFYKKLALSLAKNFSREIVPLVKFILTDSGDKAVPVDATTKESSLTGTYKALVIDEVEQPWRRGVAQVEPVNFNTTCGTILMDGDDVIWGTVEKETGDEIQNGKQIADMEWFYHGTRGDIYREATYPDNFDFKPLVDETKAYSTLDIHFAYVGPGVEVAKSERTITVVCATAAELTKLITALKTATGVDAGAVS